MDRSWFKIGHYWLTSAFVISIFSLLVYAAVQQSYRQSANDPQNQIAEDAAATIANGGSVQSVIASTSINIAQSLAPYVVVYDDLGKPIMGDGILNGSLPSLPPGVFDYVKTNGEDQFTWEPKSGVRSAVVIVQVPGNSGFVMAGRSLREVELRENMLEMMVGALWIFALIGLGVIEAIFLFWTG